MVQSNVSMEFPFRFLYVTNFPEDCHKKDDNDTNKIEQAIQKDIPWNVVKTNTNTRSPGKANQVKTQVELTNKFQ